MDTYRIQYRTDDGVADAFVVANNETKAKRAFSLKYPGVDESAIVGVSLSSKEASRKAAQTPPQPAGPQGFKFCSECGEKVSPRAVICPSCGVETGVPRSDQKPTSSVSDGTIMGGYICSFLIPVVGFIVGIYCLAKDKAGHGIGMLVVSILSSWFWVGVMTGDQSF